MPSSKKTVRKCNRAKWWTGCHCSVAVETITSILYYLANVTFGNIHFIIYHACDNNKFMIYSALWCFKEKFENNDHNFSRMTHLTHRPNWQLLQKKKSFFKNLWPPRDIEELWFRKLQGWFFKKAANCKPRNFSVNQK